LHEAKPEASAPSAVLASAVMEETAQSFREAPKSAPAKAPTPGAKRGAMKLSAVVDYVVSQVGNSSLGQLVVYRNFLRVPPQLLQAEDIVSVHLVNDGSLVRTEALKQAIASAVTEVLKRALPDSVFAPA
jgi:hypothetical protein